MLASHANGKTGLTARFHAAGVVLQWGINMGMDAAPSRVEEALVSSRTEPMGLLECALHRPTRQDMPRLCARLPLSYRAPDTCGRA
jgi:hypothetical protein